MLYCIAPPILSKADDERIARIRHLHDPLAGKVGPHVTLVFGVTGVRASLFGAHVAGVAAQAEPFPLRFVRAEAVRSHTDHRTHVFLLPEDGTAVVALHAALHTGLLAPARRTDIPFIPHMTVGAFDRHEPAVALADALNAKGIDIPAGFDRLAVVAERDAVFETLAETAL